MSTTTQSTDHTPSAASLYPHPEGAPADTAEDRRDALVAEVRARTGLDRAAIGRLVRTFYARVQDDAELAPVFAAHVRDWEAHYVKMTDFWSAVALLQGTYRGNALRAHRPVGVTPALFARWLTLFRRTTNDLFQPEAAAHLQGLAARIASSLEDRLCRDHGGLELIGQGDDEQP